jgi:hypothetical protein
MRETVIKCDLCLKDITEEEHIPNVKVKPKPKGGWSRDGGTYTFQSLELCADCETSIFKKILSLRKKGSPLRVFKEKQVKVDDIGFVSFADNYDENMRGLTERAVQ